MSVVAPSPFYDVLAAVDQLAPGVVLQRSIVDGLVTAWRAGGYVPLTQAQVIAVTGPLPAVPTSLPTLPIV